MILDVDGVFYKSHFVDGGPICHKCDFFDRQKCIPYKFSRCIDENGSCYWKKLIQEEVIDILNRVKTNGHFIFVDGQKPKI